MYKKNAASKSIKKAMSFAQFLKRFPNEKACAEYLYNIKWPDGFVCPVCGHRHGYALNPSRTVSVCQVPSPDLYYCQYCHAPYPPALNQVVLGDLSGCLRQARYLCIDPGRQNQCQL